MREKNSAAPLDACYFHLNEFPFLQTGTRLLQRRVSRRDIRKSLNSRKSCAIKYNRGKRFSPLRHPRGLSWFAAHRDAISKEKKLKILDVRKSIDITILRLSQAIFRRFFEHLFIIFVFHLRNPSKIQSYVRTRIDNKKKIDLCLYFSVYALFTNHRHRTDIQNKERWYRGTRVFFFFFIETREASIEARGAPSSPPPSTLVRCSTLKQYLLICQYNEAAL